MQKLLSCVRSQIILPKCVRDTDWTGHFSSWLMFCIGKVAQQSKMEEKRRKNKERKKTKTARGMGFGRVLWCFLQNDHSMFRKDIGQNPQKQRWLQYLAKPFLQELLTQKLEHAWTMQRLRKLQHVLAVDTLQDDRASWNSLQPCYHLTFSYFSIFRSNYCSHSDR